MNRPKVEITKTGLDKSMEWTTLLLIVGSIALLASYYNALPNKLPIHFNWPSKDAQGYGTKDLLWASPIICGLIGIGLYKLSQYPRFFNYPTEIKPENAAYSYRMSAQMLRLINLLIALLCFTVTSLSILDGLGVEQSFDRYVDPIFLILLVGIPILYAIRIKRRS
jgi:uncharacterized membrane protein